MSELSAELVAILQTGIQAIDQGEIAFNKTDEAAGLLKVISEALTTAYTFAVANVNSTDELVLKLKLVLTGTGNLEVMQAVGNFEIAREKMAEHARALRTLQNTVDAVRTSLALGTAGQTGKDSKAAFLAGVEQLRYYIQTVK